MTHRVRFLPDAETDVGEAAAWYEARRDAGRVSLAAREASDSDR
jgi:hypothetical protein